MQKVSPTQAAERQERRCKVLEMKGSCRDEMNFTLLRLGDFMGIYLYTLGVPFVRNFPLIIQGSHRVCI